MPRAGTVPEALRAVSHGILTAALWCQSLPNGPQGVSAATDSFVPCNTVTTSPVQLLNSHDVATMAEKLSFYCYVTFININLAACDRRLLRWEAQFCGPFSQPPHFTSWCITCSMPWAGCKKSMLAYQMQGRNLGCHKGNTRLPFPTLLGDPNYRWIFHLPLNFISRRNSSTTEEEGNWVLWLSTQEAIGSGGDCDKLKNSSVPL